MATQNTFVVEYGITVGTTEIISSSGKLAAAAISELDTDNLSEGSTNQYFTNARELEQSYFTCIRRNKSKL